MSYLSSIGTIAMRLLDTVPLKSVLKKLKELTVFLISISMDISVISTLILPFVVRVRVNCISYLYSIDISECAHLTLCLCSPY